MAWIARADRHQAHGAIAARGILIAAPAAVAAGIRREQRGTRRAIAAAARRIARARTTDDAIGNPRCGRARLAAPRGRENRRARSANAHAIAAIGWRHTRFTLQRAGRRLGWRGFVPGGLGVARHVHVRDHVPIRERADAARFTSDVGEQPPDFEARTRGRPLEGAAS